MQEWDPRTGERMATGWRAIRQHLLDRDAANRVGLIAAGRRGSDLKERTLINMIRNAEKHGYLVRNEFGQRRYRLTEKGRAAT